MIFDKRNENGKEEVFGKFGNLNLNKNCNLINEKAVDPSSYSSYGKKFIDKSFEVDRSNNVLNYSHNSRSFSLNFHDPVEETNKRWKNEKSEDYLNKSTLSLHIQVADSEYAEKECQMKQPKKSGIIKSAITNSFDFLRQEESEKSKTPEVSLFRASQRLISPNESNTAVTGNYQTGSSMKLWSLTLNGWQEMTEIPVNLIDNTVHSLLIFREPICNIQPTQEPTPTTALTFNFANSEVTFQRDIDVRPSTGLLCSLACIPQVGSEFKVMVHCQVENTHLRFDIPSSFVALEDDELPPELIEDFVSLIIQTDHQMVSEVDQENHAISVTPAQEKFKNLLINLEENKKLAFASPLNSIPANKLHHNLTARALCEPRISEIRILIETKQLDLSAVVFHVIPHHSIADNYEIVKGNQTFGAYLQLKNLKKAVPSNLKCKVYERNQSFGPLEIALNASKTKNEQPLTYLEKISAVRKILERNDISRDSVNKRKVGELKKLYNFLFPPDDLPSTLCYLIGLPADVFENCLTASKKFSSGEICYSTKKPLEFCPQPYKNKNIKSLNCDFFWSLFCKSHRQNSPFAMAALNKMSLTFGVEDALKEFKNTVADFTQKLKNSGVHYDGTFEQAVETFGFPSDISQEQAHFLLANRDIQKHLTRQKDFSVDKARTNILSFLSKVHNIKFEATEEILDVKSYELIICFSQLDWCTFDLPNNGLIIDFCYNNDPQLGHEIPAAWNIQFLTKGPQVPESGNLPLTTIQARMFLLADGAEKNIGAAKNILQQRAEEKSIKVGSVMGINDLTSIFKFADAKSSCYIHEPPNEWIDLIVCGIVKEVKDCPKVTVSTTDSNKSSRVKELLSNAVTSQWQQQAEEAGTPSRPRKKRGQTSVPPSPNPSADPATPKSRQRQKGGTASVNPPPPPPQES